MAHVPMNSHLQAALRALLLVTLFALCCGSAFGYAGVTSEYAANRALVSAAKLTAAEAISNAAASARAVGSVNLLGPGGRAVAVDLAATFSKRAAITAVGGAFSTLAPPLAAAALAWSIYDAVRARPAPGGGFEVDAGVPSVLQAQQCNAIPFPNRAVGTVCADNAAGVCSAHLSLSTAPPGGHFYCSPQSATSYYLVVCYDGPCGSPVYGALIVTMPKQVEKCPPPFGGTIGADGRCPTGQYTVQETPEEVADRIVNAQRAVEVDLAALMREALGFAQGDLDIPAYVPQEITGPVPSIQGPVTTTTNADGSTVEEAVGWDFRKDVDKPNQGTWDLKKTTTAKDAAGTTTGSSTQVTQTPTGTPEAKAEDPCTANPGRVGCTELGTPPDAAKTTSSQGIAYSPQTFASATCPAAVQFTAFGSARALEFTPLCEAASTWVRGVCLVVSAALAGFIFVGGLKS